MSDTVKNPVERGAEALWEAIDDKGIRGRLYRDDCDFACRAVFASIEPVALARVLAVANGTEWDFSPDEPEDPYMRDARAILAYLTGGES